ncbi:hypothetical protein OAS39_07965 [Pirellulales bacterium]|nr:hypothetical protein [Pirellulales bacterium]
MNFREMSQKLSGKPTTEKQEKKNHPEVVIQIPGTENLESAIWSRDGKDGTKKYSFSLSRRYGRNLENLTRSFSLTSAEAYEVLYSHWYLFEFFSNQGPLDERKGFADLALRLATAFEFKTQPQRTEVTATPQVVNGATFAQAALANGSTQSTPPVFAQAR